MSKEVLYKSPLARHIEGFLDEKIALGYKYTAESRIMRRFDRYWVEHGCGEIGLTADTIADWIQKGSQESAGQLRNRIIVVRQFSIYLNGLFIPSYIPPLKIRREKHLRHLLTKPEIKDLFSQIDTHALKGKGSTVATRRMVDEYPVLFRLIYLNGMRISEACGLLVSQIDLDSGILTILDGKGNTDRLIYLSEDMRLLCIAYLHHLQESLGKMPRWFFPGRNADKPISISAVEREFNSFWSKTSFAEGCAKKPTVHDLRHAYVVHRINLWLEQGLDFEHMLPYLSKFLGHKGFDETFYYYHYAEEAAHTIHKMDTVILKVIPEVMRR